jgi:hypothetical protein
MATAWMLMHICQDHAKGITGTIQASLTSGDHTEVSSFIQSCDLPNLFLILNLADFHQFCPDRENCSMGDNSDQILNLIVNGIKQCPDHGIYVKNIIEKSSESIDEYLTRRNYFYLLGVIATPEAISVLGEFLYDDRNPEATLPRDAGIHIAPNSIRAVSALKQAIGALPDTPQSRVLIKSDDLTAWQGWWESEAADVYRVSGARKSETSNNRPLVSKEPTGWTIWALAIGSFSALVILLILRLIKWRSIS